MLVKPPPTIILSPPSANTFTRPSAPGFQGFTVTVAESTAAIFSRGTSTFTDWKLPPIYTVPFDTSRECTIPLMSGFQEVGVPLIRSIAAI